MKMINFFTRFFLFFFLFSLLLEITSLASVQIDYPGYFSEDVNLPGIPSKNIDEYKSELLIWSKKYNIILDQTIINAYIQKSIDMGFESNVNIQIEDEDYTLFDKNILVMDLMRDLIFLETMQKSITHWNSNYIYSNKNFSEAYNRAINIWDVYKEYMNLGNFNKDHINPIVNALFGSGGNTYGNIFLSDGTIEKIYEDRIISLAESSVNAAFGNENFIDSIYNGAVNITTLADITTNFIVNIIKQYDGEIGQLGDTLSTAAFGIAGGGFGMVLAPAQIFASTVDYIATSFKNVSKGAHLINYYYFTKYYPDFTKQYLLNSDPTSLYYGVIDNFIRLQELRNFEDLSQDQIALDLTSGYYHLSNSATIEEAKAAYAIAGLLITIEKLDIEKLKRNLVARIKIEDIKEHGFLMNTSYSSETDQYEITLPEKIVYNENHGGYPKSISYELNNQEIFSVFPNSVLSKQYVEGTDLVKNLSLTLSQYENTKKDSTLSVTIIFHDNFQMNSSHKLIFYPQITNFELQKTTSGKIFDDQDNKIYISYCGDNISYLDLFYKNQDDDQFNIIEHELNTNSITSNNENCTTHYLIINTSKLRYNAGYGDISFYAKAASKKTNIINLLFVDPNDIDNDKLPDSWEEQYFGNLIQSTYDDYDNDNKTNYQEYVIETDPTKVGLEEIIKTITLKPYQDINGNWVNTYYLSGEINAHVILENGTINLDGKALHINGNIYLKGGVLFINKGKLTITGSLITSGSSKLRMITAEDLIIIEKDMEIGGSSTIKGSEYNGGSIVESYLTNGIIKLKGNLKQIGTGHGYGNSNVNTTSKTYFWMNSNNKYSFYSSGKHTVIFNGTAKQNISFSSTSSKFSKIILDNNSKEGIEFLTSFKFNSLDQRKSIINGDINLTNGITLSHDLSINGNFTISSGILDLTNCKILIYKDFTAKGDSVLNINKGNMVVQGNIFIQESSKLKMIHSEDLIIIDGNMEIGGSSSIKGNEYNGGSIVDSYLTDGTIKLKGNFKQIGTGHGYGNSNVNTTNQTYYWMNPNNKYSFYSSGKHTVIFNGTKKQVISFSSTSSKFCKVLLENDSNEGVNFLTSFRFSTLDQNDTRIIGDMNLTNPATLSHDLIIDGNFSISSGVLDLTNCNLLITKDFTAKGDSILNVNKGQMIVNGNLYFQGASKLKMIHSEDLIVVDEDLEIGGSSSIKGNKYNGGLIAESYLTDGIIKLKGNFKQIGTGLGYGNSKVNSTDKAYYWMNSNNKYSFYTSGNHTVIFNGTAKQSISYSSTNSMFNNLILKNTSENGVEFKTTIYAVGTIQSNESNIVNAKNLNLQKVGRLNGNWNNNLTLNNGWLLSDNQEINGNLYLTGGTLEPNNNTLTIIGNLITLGTSKLKMTNPEDQIIIEGNFEIGGSSLIKGKEYNGGSIVESYLTCGTIKLKGNFAQIGNGQGYGNSNANSTSKTYYWMNPNNMYSFYSSGDHTIIFNGTSKQDVSFSSTGSKFSKVILENSSNEGVEFLTSFRFNSLKQNNSKIIGDINLTNGMTLSHNLSMDGNLSISSGTLDLNNCNLLISKNFIAKGNTVLNINKGNMFVQRNISLVDTAKLKMIHSEDLIVIGEDMEIGGSSSIKGNAYNGGSIVESYLVDGTIKLKGNFKQIGTGHGYGNSNANSSSKAYYWMNPNNKYSFYTSGNHTVILNGTTKQSISFSSTSSMFNNLILENTSEEGVDFETKIYAVGKIKSNDSNILNAKNLNLQKVGSLNGIWNNDLTLNKGWQLSGDQEINGNLYLTGGTLEPTKNTLIINGSLITSGSSKLKMINPEDQIVVGGNFEIGGSSTIKGNAYNGGSIVESYLTDGTIKVKGDFKQVGTGLGYGNSTANSTSRSHYWMNSNNKYSFYTSGNHIVILNGNAKQSVLFQSANSKFNILVSENRSNEGIDFLSKIVVSKLFNHNRNTFKIYEMSSFNDYDSDNINDNIDYYPLNPNKWKEYLPDIDQNGTVNITDVILALKIISSNHFDSSYIKGLDEIVCILQILVNIESEFCN